MKTNSVLAHTQRYVGTLKEVSRRVFIDWCINQTFAAPVADEWLVLPQSLQAGADRFEKPNSNRVVEGVIVWFSCRGSLQIPVG
jgi:hypothetical protein